MKRTRILYICLFAAALVFAYFNGGRIPYMFLYTMLLLPAFSVLYTLIIYMRFKLGQDLDKRFVTKGDRVSFLFSINNEDFLLYPYLKVSLYGSDTIFENQYQIRNFSLPPFSGRNYAFELQCNYRGNYEIGIDSVEIEDFFGLIKLRYNVGEPKYVTVYPKIVYLEKFHLRTDFMSEVHSMLNTRDEDMTTISEIRKYQYGDSMKRIHWKLTARTQELMVRKFQSTSETNTLLLLDLRKNHYSPGENIMLEDKLIEAVVAVLYYCLNKWIPVELVFFSESLHSIQAKNHLMFNEIYETLARVRFSDDVAVEDLLEIYTETAPKNSNIVVFTSNLGYGLYNQLCKTLDSGYNVSLVYISPEKITGTRDQEIENILTSLPEIGIKSYRIGLDDDTRAVLES
ncbi:MAG: DUF58 domain-containing protein [Clostridiaceae bacterium]|jgi:uncharacterized protein (DUF58 family)|nr:DUF58 domain-containing protein [Clostridiaceae bacterium]